MMMMIFTWTNYKRGVLKNLFYLFLTQEGGLLRDYKQNHTYTYLNIYVYIHIYEYIYIQIFTYLDNFTYTHIYAHIYLYTQVKIPLTDTGGGAPS
jgi:hypothetical protein